MARRKPKPQPRRKHPLYADSPVPPDPHIFAANIHGPKDHRGDPIECLHCPLLRWNAVHITSEELAESLPPVPEEDVSDRIIGEAG